VMRSGWVKGVGTGKVRGNNADSESRDGVASSLAMEVRLKYYLFVYVKNVDVQVCQNESAISHSFREVTKRVH